MMIFGLITLTTAAVMMSHLLSSVSSMTLLLLILSLMTSVYILKLGNFWLALVMILLYVGGMMIMFLYITSLSTTKKFIYKSNWVWLFFMSIFILGGCLMLMPSMSCLGSSSVVAKLFSLSASPLLGVVSIYLLFILVTVVKLTEKDSGALKSYKW